MQLDKGGYMDCSMIRPLRGRGSPLYCSPVCGTNGGGPAGPAGCVEGLCRKVRRKGSKGSEGSTGKVDGAFGPEGCGGGFAAIFKKRGRGWRRRLCRRVVREKVQRVHKVQRVWIAAGGGNEYL